MPTSTPRARPGRSLQTADPTVPQDTQHDALRPPSRPLNPGLTESLAIGCALVTCLVVRVPDEVLNAAGIRAWGLALVVVVGIVSGARAVARAPFTLHRSLRGSPDRNVAIRQWAGGELEMVLITMAVGTVMTVPLYALLRATPYWWLLAWLMFTAVTVLSQTVMPFAIRAQAGPLTAAPATLTERLQHLATRAEVDVGRGVVVATGHHRRRSNAYVVGLGPTRRVVLERALIAWPPELVDQAVAHELGHWRLGHASRRLPLAILCQLVTLAAAAAALSWAPLLDWAGVTNAGDPRSYPLLLILGAVLVLPARCALAWYDRAQERAADRFALTLLGRPDEFAEMLDRAADESGAPRCLPWWRHLTASHPPIDERAAACRMGLLFESTE